VDHFLIYSVAIFIYLFVVTYTVSVKNGGLVVPKLKRERGQDRRVAAVRRTFYFTFFLG
jgi:hypothetical protein